MKRVSSPKRKDKAAKPTAADRRLARMPDVLAKDEWLAQLIVRTLHEIPTCRCHDCYLVKVQTVAYVLSAARVEQRKRKGRKSKK